MNNKRKKYNIFESFMNLFHAFRTTKYLKKAKKAGSLDEQFQERLMLAVTEVNGCAMCSYAHTRMALEAGLDSDSIKNLLSGTFDGIPEEQLPSVLFAQHYAETRGKPTKATWDQIVKDYNKTTALGILGAIRMIMVGNTYGMPFGSFILRFSRDKSKIDERSNLGYELIMLITVIPFTIIALIFAKLANLFGLRVI